MHPTDRGQPSGWQFVIVDELEKVYPDRAPRPLDRTIPQAVFIGEPASVQVAFRPPYDGEVPLTVDLRLEVASGSARVSTATVELVPVELPAYPEHDPWYDDDRPGLYPDLLRPITNGRLRPVAGQWRAAWIDIKADRPGWHRVAIRVVADGRPVLEDEVEVEVLAVSPPELDLVNSHWIHADALADYYRVDVFGERHWSILGSFLTAAAEMGVTSVLTPVWTPPLDTAVGSYRTPVQLVGVHAGDDSYSFDFSLLHRWIDTCQRVGIRRLEVSHLFTQWGARNCPAIYADNNGTIERRFGWDCASTDPAYRTFLAALLPQLLEVLDARVGRENIVFHISDEPPVDSIAAYHAARTQVADLLAGWKIVDALSHIEFLTSGAVPVPVVATDAIEDFLDPRPPELWAYYCLAQHRRVANRFIAMPSARSRALGHQLFVFEIDGFLHWGFNFYYSRLAERLVDPFNDTCADGSFPGGDAFVVYPGPAGEPWQSIRFKVLAQVAWDLRAMELLARLEGRKAVLEVVDPNGSLRFDDYPLDPSHYLRARAEIYRRIAAHR